MLHFAGVWNIIIFWTWNPEGIISNIPTKNEGYLKFLIIDAQTINE